MRLLTLLCISFVESVNIHKLSRTAVAMLEPVRDVLNQTKVILASSSKPRREILQTAGLNFEVIVSDFEENLDPEKFPNLGLFTIETANGKVIEVSKKFEHQSKPYLIIGADTVVSFNGKVYGKPKSSDEARQFLKELSGNTHSVYTGVVLKSSQHESKFFIETNVKMADLDTEVINAYVDTNEPLNKAGAYGIQGMGGSLIEKIDGDYFNVVGLPLHAICSNIVKMCKQMRVGMKA